MQIEVNRRALLRGLKAAATVTEKRSTIPILSSLLMRANGSLELMATDLDIERQVTVPIVEGVGAGDYLIEDPRALEAVLKEASSERVQLTTEPLEGGGHRIEWRAGPIATRGPRNMDPVDFPRIFLTPHFVEATVGADFLRALRRLMPAISTEETRYYLNGIAIQHLGDWSYRLAATDGHRLHIAQVELPDAKGDQWGGDAIIPRRTLARLLDILAGAKDGARLSFGSFLTGNGVPKTLPVDGSPRATAPNAVRIAGDGDSVTSKLIDGTFPDVMRVVPAVAQTTLRVKTADLRRAVAAARAGMTGSHFRAVRITVGHGGQLTVSSAGADGFETSVVIDAEATAHGFQIGFNGNYLMQSLDALGGEVTVMAWDALPGEGYSGVAAAPCKLIDPADDKFFAVLMPMRV